MATPMSLIAYCPECDARIRFTNKPSIGQRLTCRECEQVLEVIGLQPLELDWAYDDRDALRPSEADGDPLLGDSWPALDDE